jgi:hypothetical protein
MSNTEEYYSDRFATEALGYTKAKETFDASIDALLEWRRVRPFLFDGQCSYSRMLLRTILDSYLACCTFKPEEPDPKLIALIHKLMRSGPPPRTPPSSKARPGLCFLLGFPLHYLHALGRFHFNVWQEETTHSKKFATSASSLT